jgi:DNA-binding IclR family transcriptional regulator
VQNSPPLPPYAIESVDNALRLLLLFRKTDVIRVTDAADALGVARSTAHRLLLTLANQGFVQQERNSRSYRAGPSLMEFGFWTASLPEIRTAARPHLEALAQELEETTNLLVLEGDGARFVDSVESIRTVRVSGRTGTLLPAFATAGGKALLAALADADARALLSGRLRRMTSVTITNRNELFEELSDIRRLGYAINRGESLDGLHAVAVCIRDANGFAVAALAASVPADRGNIKRLRGFVPSLRASALEIGNALQRRTAHTASASPPSLC